MNARKIRALIFILTIIFCINSNIQVVLLNKKINKLTFNQELMLSQIKETEDEVKHTRQEIDVLLDKYSKKFGVEPALVHAVAQVESGKKQSAISKSKAVGVMQLMPSTAKYLKVNPYNTEDNIKGGVKYLSILQQRFKDEDKVIASYNAGPTAVDKHDGVPPYKETQNYVKKVKKEKQKYLDKSK